MRKVGIVITNPNHHWEMVASVVHELSATKKVQPILISLCGFRRLPEPDGVPEYIEVRYGPDMRKLGLKKESGQSELGGGGSKKRNIVHELLWWLWLRWQLMPLFKHIHGVLFLNDQSYPMNRVVPLLKKKRKWLGLLQEGIRFPLPNETYFGYGSSQPDCLFVWGEASAEFFSGRIDNKLTGIIVSGNPRYWELLQQDWTTEAKSLKLLYKPSGKVIGFASNPIDDQGFCDTIEKERITKDFLIAAYKVLQPEGGQLWVKLHPRENAQFIQELIEQDGLGDVIQIHVGNSIFPFLEAVDRVVILASTVGLEAMAMDRPVAVLPIPGHGFVHDYVSSGAACVLNSKQLKASLVDWIATSAGAARMNDYVNHHLQMAMDPTSIIVNSILDEVPV